MVIFFFGNDMCFCGKSCKVIISWCEGKGANIAAVEEDSPCVLVLPSQLNVVMLGDTGAAVLMPLLFRHGLLHPMLW